MTRERFEEIFEKTDTDFKKHKKLGDHTLAGLNIISKYIPNYVICGADHDILYSVNIDELIKAGIVEEDVILLRELNFIINGGDYLASYV